MSGYLWKGRPIEDLSREELLSALEIMLRIEASLRQDNRQVLDSWRACRSARRGS
jgi:hypothetical protein